VTLDVDLQRWGADIDLPLDPDARLPKTATGDLRLISGYELLRRWLQRMALAMPGELIHRPEFGGGITGAIERASTPGRRAQLQNQIRRAVLRDGRFADARVVVSEGVAEAGTTNKRGITVRIEARVQGDDDWISVSASVAG
jgi:phage baseplate assembly protein W